MNNYRSTLQKLINLMECNLPNIMEHSKLNINNHVYEGMVDWNCDNNSRKFELFTYSKHQNKPINLAKISISCHDNIFEFAEMINKCFSFEIPKYFEDNEFVIRSKSVSCKRIKKNEKFMLIFYFE